MARCLVSTCERPVRARGWCHTHYMRWYTNKSIDPPKSNLNAIAPQDIGWVAGILEGEGSFGAYPRRTDRLYPKVAVQMTDRDVVERLRSVVGVGNVTTLTVRGLMTKPSYTWTLSRLVDVVAFSSLIRPLLGIRRTAQLDSMLDKSGLVNATFPRTRRTFRIEENL